MRFLVHLFLLGSLTATGGRSLKTQECDRYLVWTICLTEQLIMTRRIVGICLTGQLNVKLTFKTHHSASPSFVPVDELFKEANIKLNGNVNYEEFTQMVMLPPVDY